MANRQIKTAKLNLLALATLLLALLAVSVSAVSGPVVASSRQHIVQPGDTLTIIARLYSTDVVALVELNQIANPDLIFAGNVLWVAQPDSPRPQEIQDAARQPPELKIAPASNPEPPMDLNTVDSAITDASDAPAFQPTPQSSPSMPWVDYVIQQGDWLSTIAAKHGTTLSELAQVNKITNPNIIFAGQIISVPAIEAPPQATPVPSNPPSGSPPPSFGARPPSSPATSPPPISLEPPSSSLATPTPPQADLDLNSVETPGNQPPPAPTDENLASQSAVAYQVQLRHTVKSGETLSGIAAHYGLASHLELLNANPSLGSGPLRVGTSLVIPGVTVEDRLEFWGLHYNIPLELFKALTWWESGWNNSLTSYAGAIGIGQLIPATVDFVSDVLLGIKLDPYNPDDNIRMSARFVRYLLDETGNDRTYTLGAYYQGLYSVRTRGIYLSSMQYVTGILALQSRFK